jgi:hypothetical protein
MRRVKMDWIWNSNGQKKIFVQNLGVGKPQRDQPLGSPRGWEDNINMGLKEAVLLIWRSLEVVQYHI